VYFKPDISCERERETSVQELGHVEDIVIKVSIRLTIAYNYATQLLN